ncbi:MAG TPA: PIN domain-containing protein [Iamia sp.]|jgi:predicted nucleic acid-binding protein|nr:PIN domain-containing protein [Iamia sp.]
MTIALDTSAAVPFVMASHGAHRATRQRLGTKDLVLTQHSLAETYSVLTRLPGDARVAPEDAVRLLAANFGEPALLPPADARTLPALLAPLGISGGATYDALVALAARAHALPLATRDVRAAATYAALGVDIELVADG